MDLGDENDSQLKTMAVDADNKTVAATAADQVCVCVFLWVSYACMVVYGGVYNMHILWVC